TRRLPHLQLPPQEYRYVHNLSFRGPQNLWVEWNPEKNPERCNPSVREGPVQPVRLGPPDAKSLVRKLEVIAADRMTPNIMRLRLKSSSDQALPAWTAGSHIDIQ